jgi:4-carboxymuconolactone decarboxylase
VEGADPAHAHFGRPQARHPGYPARPAVTSTTRSPAPYRRSVSDYLPAIYKRVRDQYPEVAGALDQLGRVSDGAGPLDDRSCRLVKLGIAIGALAEGAVRSNARKALDAGVTPDEIRHAAVLAITTRGFPAAVAALGWIDQALSRDT